MTTDSSDAGDNDFAIVIDNGSGLMKCGFGGDDLPRAVFPSVVGRPRHKGVMVGMGQSDAYVGDEGMSKRGILSLKYPIEHGIVNSWDDIEKIWHYSFYNELIIQPEEHCVLLTEKPLNPKTHREKMTQIIFETFNVPAFYLSNQAVLTLYASGKTTGIVIESGESVTHIVPVYDGIYLPGPTRRIYIGGYHITDYLRKMLNERGYNITTTYQEMEIVKDIKIKHGFVSMDYKKDLETETKHKYELPDGLFLDFSTETFQCAEVLFEPQLIGLTDVGISDTVYDCIHSCDIDLRNELFSNIVFGGGNTMFKGIEERLLKELNCKVSKHVLVNGYVRKYYKNALYKDIVHLMNEYSSYKPMVIPSTQKAYSAWIGGSILSSLSTFPDICMTSDEYNESGPSLVHRKCF